MKVPEKSEERAREISFPVIAFAIGVVFFDVLLIQVLSIGWFGRETFAVWIAPPVEEAIKGGLASLMGILYLSRYRKGWLTRFKPITWAIGAGVLSGVIFALSESLMQGESALAIGTGLYTHPIWAAGVSIGCWSLLLNGKKRFLVGIYPIAVAGHMSWNYYVQNSADLTRYLAALLITVIIAIIFWRYSKDQLSIS